MRKYFLGLSAITAIAATAMSLQAGPTRAAGIPAQCEVTCSNGKCSMTWNTWESGCGCECTPTGEPRCRCDSDE